MGQVRWWSRAILINLVVLFIVLFFTTPGQILKFRFYNLDFTISKDKFRIKGRRFHNLEFHVLSTIPILEYFLIFTSPVVIVQFLYTMFFGDESDSDSSSSDVRLFRSFLLVLCLSGACQLSSGFHCQKQASTDFIANENRLIIK